MKFKMSRTTLSGFICYLFSVTIVSGVFQLLTSCDDEPVCNSPITPDEEQSRMISFSLLDEHFSISDNNTSILLSLISSDGLTQVFNAIAEKSGGGLSLRISVPTDVSIPDGRYIMTMRHENGQNITGRLSCVFENESLSSVNIILPKYMLDGSGTEEDPFIIGGSDDFEMFLINLADDKESYGAGLKFLQTADVVAPDQSTLIPGRGYWGSPFAGIYDGGGHAITSIYYLGNNRENSDSGFGVFQKLIGSSTIENLSMSGVNVNGLYKESGIIAGSVSGDVAFKNISLSGNIEGGFSLGGLTGLVEGGNLTIENISFRASVKGNDNVGGLVGKVNSGAKIKVSDISTPDTRFLVSGKNHVGGVVGVVAGSASFKNIRIDHKVSNEDSDIRVIAGNGDGTGGIIGAVSNNAKGIDITDCYVLCPLGGNSANCVGGLVGIMEGIKMDISNCRIYSVVAGNENVGGLIGKVKMPQIAEGICISGEDYSTRISVDDADAGISGVDYVGGFAGWWEGKIKLDTKIKINLPITSSGFAAGGAFGCIYDSNIDATRFVIGHNDAGNNTLHISGQKETGGIVGRLWKSTLQSDSEFNFAVVDDNAKLPETDQFYPAFNGVVTGTERVGGIVGYGLSSDIRGIYSTAHVTGSNDVGGIVGRMEDDSYNASNIIDCIFQGILDCSAAKNVGGIIGHYRSVGHGTLQDCVNYSDIKGGDYDGGTGGIIGYVSKAQQVNNILPLDIKWCANAGKVEGNLHVGGIVGKSWEEDSNVVNLGPATSVTISISDCVNVGTIYGEGGSSSEAAVGGILGFSNYLTGVMRCANHGYVYGHEACHGIGGIAGSMGHDPKGAGLTTHYRNMILEQCINTGTIDAGARSSFVGGILGYQEEGEQSNVENCVNHGNIPPAQDHDSGGIVGCVDHLTYIYRCVNKGKVDHGNATIGTHKSGSIFNHDYLYFLEGTGSGWPSATKLNTVSFTDESKYKGFDFKNVWKMTTEGPMLRNNRWNMM